MGGDANYRTNSLMNFLTRLILYEGVIVMRTGICPNCNNNLIKVIKDEHYPNGIGNIPFG